MKGQGGDGVLEPAVAILRYGMRAGFGLSNVALDDLSWPLGQPYRLRGKHIADLEPRDHLIGFASSRFLFLPWPGTHAKVSVMVVEPKALQATKMAWLRKLLHRRFYRVLACNPELLAGIPNGIRFIFGSTWIEDWRTVDRTKTRMVSLIASSKTQLEGHRLRHQLVEHIRSVKIHADIIGRGYRSFERKADGLAPYRYSAIIENVRETSYITEKLIDCLLCETVPIYWGAPDIGTVFDTRGMIVCETFDDMKTAIEGLSEEDYLSRLEFIRQNREKASRYADHEKAAARLVLGADS